MGKKKCPKDVAKRRVAAGGPHVLEETCKPRLVLRGDTTKHIDFTNVDEGLKDPNYVSVGSHHCMPRDIRQLERFLTSSGQMKDLQMIVMLLIGIDVFLRHDELGEVAFDAFLAEEHHRRIEQSVEKRTR